MVLGEVFILERTTPNYYDRVDSCAYLWSFIYVNELQNQQIIGGLDPVYERVQTIFAHLGVPRSIGQADVLIT